jgi:hypothetical protein
MAFQAALAAGAPLDDGAWGGAHTHLTTGQRVGSAASVVFYALAILVVQRRAAGRTARRYRWGTWAPVVILVLAALANVASDSRWENYLLAPVALALAGLCVVVMRGADEPAAREPDTRRLVAHGR